MAKIVSIIIHHNSTVTLFYEGADILTDYCPMASRITQRAAIEEIAKRGTISGCRVEVFNHREAGHIWPPEAKKAKAFAAKIKLPYHDKVRFPDAGNPADALALAGTLEPGLKVKVTTHTAYKDGVGPMGLWHRCETL